MIQFYEPNVIMSSFWCRRNFGGQFISFFRSRQNIEYQICQKKCNKYFENRLVNKYFMSKNIFDRDSSRVKKHGREVTIFPENFISLNMLSKTLEFNIESHERHIWDQNNNFNGIQSLWWWIIALAHANSLFKMFFGINFYLWSDFHNFCHTFYDKLIFNISMKIFYLVNYKLKIIQENAFSETSFSTLVFYSVEIWRKLP